MAGVSPEWLAFLPDGWRLSGMAGAQNVIMLVILILMLVILVLMPVNQTLIDVNEIMETINNSIMSVNQKNRLAKYRV